MAASESAAHLELKRAAISWAQLNGYSATAAELTLPNFRCRLDVAAYRPASGKRSDNNAEIVGQTAIFECKQCRSDFRRNAQCAALIRAKLQSLHERKAALEDVLRIHYPSLRNGDSLFSEYETCDFPKAGYELYEQAVTQIRALSNRLHAQTKFDDLRRWNAANVHYIVALPDLFELHEMPAGWGLLVKAGDTLELHTKPLWHHVEAEKRLIFLQRIAAAGSRAINRQLGVIHPRWRRTVHD